MKKFSKSNKGFTLVELIIVIAIIAILTVVAAPQYLKYVDKARLSKDQNEAASLQTVVETHLVDVNSNEDAKDDITAATVTFTASGVTVSSVTGGEQASAKLTAAITDNGMNSIKVTNKGTYSSGFATYTITIASSKIDTTNTKWS